MATEQNLTTINIFGSQTDFDSHTSEIREDELSLIKINDLEIPGSVYSKGAKLRPLEFNNLTLLCDFNTGTGNITLSQPYTDFDGLLFETANDGRSMWHYSFISTWELSQAKQRYFENDTLKSYDISFGAWYWTLNLQTMTTTNLAMSSENSWIFKVYGVTA